jgi:hypothetical protein
MKFGAAIKRARLFRPLPEPQRSPRMPLLQVALIVSARRELILSAGEAPAGAPGGASFELTQESIQTLDGPAFLKVGLTRPGP